MQIWKALEVQWGGSICVPSALSLLGRLPELDNNAKLTNACQPMMQNETKS